MTRLLHELRIAGRRKEPSDGVALQHTPWFRPGGIAFVAALAIMVVWPAGAQVPTTDAAYRWQSLNEQLADGYQAGDYPKAVALAERALELARQAFGERELRTLTSLNDLAR